MHFILLLVNSFLVIYLQLQTRSTMRPTDATARGVCTMAWIVKKNVIFVKRLLIHAKMELLANQLMTH
jgi:hypothetical protein